MAQTRLFVTDLDGTLAGNAAALSQFKTFLNGFAQPPVLVYVTGRHLHSALELIEHDDLPQPDTLITDIGTAIYTGQSLLEDDQWRQRMQQDWQPDVICDIASKFSELTVQDLPTTKRVSSFAADADTVRAFEKALTRNEIAHKLIYSADTYVDVLPRGSGKGEAVTYALDTFYEQDAQILVSGGYR